MAGFRFLKGQKAQPEPACSGDRPQQPRILVYDDDEGFACATGIILRRAGYAVEVATHFDPALKILDQPWMDLLLTDLVIPGGVSGIAMARMARSRHSAIKVVYVTGYDIEEAREVAPVLRKPISEETLLSEVKAALHSGASQ